LCLKIGSTCIKGEYAGLVSVGVLEKLLLAVRVLGVELAVLTSDVLVLWLVHSIS
jgi:hypothetical protein